MHHDDQRPRKFVWPLQAMPLARAISLSYALLIIYVSLNPFDFNFDNGIAPWAWLDAPLPRFITLFDVSVNILAYIPLGFLLVFACYPRWRNFVALGIALSFSAALAFSVESLQTWLPTRIPSQMDWWANVLGGLMGGLLAIPLGPQWLSGSVVRRRFDQWFGLNWAACALFLLFPWAQIYPPPKLLVGHRCMGACDLCLSRLGNHGRQPRRSGIDHYGHLLAWYWTLAITGYAYKSAPVENLKWPALFHCFDQDCLYCIAIWGGV